MDWKEEEFKKVFDPIIDDIGYILASFQRTNAIAGWVSLRTTDLIEATARFKEILKVQGVFDTHKLKFSNEKQGDDYGFRINK
jgi:hypothetical protein